MEFKLGLFSIELRDQLVLAKLRVCPTDEMLKRFGLFKLEGILPQYFSDFFFDKNFYYGKKDQYLRKRTSPDVNDELVLQKGKVIEGLNEMQYDEVNLESFPSETINFLSYDFVRYISPVNSNVYLDEVVKPIPFRTLTCRHRSSRREASGIVEGKFEGKFAQEELSLLVKLFFKISIYPGINMMEQLRHTVMDTGELLPCPTKFMHVMNCIKQQDYLCIFKKFDASVVSIEYCLNNVVDNNPEDKGVKEFAWYVTVEVFRCHRAVQNKVNMDLFCRALVSQRAEFLASSHTIAVVDFI